MKLKILEQRHEIWPTDRPLSCEPREGFGSRGCVVRGSSAAAAGWLAPILHDPARGAKHSGSSRLPGPPSRDLRPMNTNERHAHIAHRGLLFLSRDADQGNIAPSQRSASEAARSAVRCMLLLGCVLRSVTKNIVKITEAFG